MADFVAVLKKTIDGLGETTPDVREKVYQKARHTVGAKLAALNPPPPAAVAERQRQALEDAIRTIEAEYAASVSAVDPLAELDALFAELKPKEKPAAPPRAPVPPAGPAARPAEPVSTAAARPAPEPSGPLGPRRQPAPAPANPVSPAASAQPRGPAPTAPVSPPAEPAVADLRREEYAQVHEPDASDARPRRQPDTSGLEDLDRPLPPRKPARRAGLGLWLAVAAVLVVIGGAGYALYLNKDSFLAMMAGGTQLAAVDPGADDEPAAPVAVAPVEEEAEIEDAGAAREEPAPPQQVAAVENGKFTQRLNADGTEVDTGPAGGQPTVGEGTSVASATPGTDGGAQASAAAAEEETSGPAAPEPAPAVAVGQKAIFYEERTSTAEGSADAGSIVWSLVRESPGADLPPEPVIRAEATIPDKGLQLRMTIRRNGDETLPASHIVELIFLTPEDFPSGPIDNVLRMTMKETEQAAGSALIGIPAKIADGFFLVALNDGEREVQANTQLLLRQRWIDVPIVYQSGRRALITMEKGLPGERVFEEALRAWQTASSG